MKYSRLAGCQRGGGFLSVCVQGAIEEEKMVWGDEQVPSTWQEGQMCIKQRPGQEWAEHVREAGGWKLMLGGHIRLRVNVYCSRCVPWGKEKTQENAFVERLNSVCTHVVQKYLLHICLLCSAHTLTSYNPRQPLLFVFICSLPKALYANRNVHCYFFLLHKWQHFMHYFFYFDFFP